MTDINDKRAAPRKIVHFAAEVERDGERLGCAMSLDASGTGLLLLADFAPEVGSTLLLRLYVPREEGAHDFVVSVARCEKIPAAEGIVWSHRVGVQLEPPSDDVQRLIEIYAKDR